MSHRVIERTLDQLRAAVDKLAMGDDVGYDATLIPAPGPNGPQPATLIVLTIPSLLIGQQMAATTVLPSAELHDQTVESLVTQNLEGLRAARTQQVQEAQSQSPAANGHGQASAPNPSGLIRP